MTTPVNVAVSSRSHDDMKTLIGVENEADNTSYGGRRRYVVRAVWRLGYRRSSRRCMTTRGHDDMTPKLTETALVGQLSLDLSRQLDITGQLADALRRIEAAASVDSGNAHAEHDAAAFRRIQQMAAAALRG
jgi:hypothetical protein